MYCNVSVLFHRNLRHLLLCGSSILEILDINCTINLLNAHIILWSSKLLSTLLAKYEIEYGNKILCFNLALKRMN